MKKSERNQNQADRREIEVTAKNLWFLERSLPLFDFLDFFPPDSIGAPEFDRGSYDGMPSRKLTIETDLGWALTTDITRDSKTFRNKSRNRGTGKWIADVKPEPGDKIVIEKIESHRYSLKLERK